MANDEREFGKRLLRIESEENITMERPLVSVVMPSYNHERYVAKAIESVLKQTYTNFELIIVDDASEDRTADIIQQYKDLRIKFVGLKVNTGFGAAEKGFKMAKGKYIATLASDDMWDSCLLEKYVKFLEVNDEYLCCFSIPRIIDENDRKIEDNIMESIFFHENRTKEQWFKRLYMEGNCLCAPSVCMRYSVYEQLGGMRYQYRQLQDYEYWLRLVQMGNIYVYPERLMCYRKHYNENNANISAPSREVQIRDAMERKYIMLDIIENIDDQFFYEAFKDMFVRNPDDVGFFLDCEKYGVMLNSPAVPIHATIFFYFNHYKDQNFRYYLENYYQVHRKDVWKLTGVELDRRGLAAAEQARERELIRMIVELRRELQELKMSYEK